MKKLLLILNIIASTYCVISQEANYFSLKNDKMKHTIAGIIVSGSTYYSSHAIWQDPGVSFRMSVALNVSIATGKEMYDSMNGGRWSFEDQGFTILSGLIISGISYFVAKKRQKKKLMALMRDRDRS